MMENFKIGFVFLSFLISFVTGWFVIPRIILIAKRKRLFDKLDHRKEAKPPTPRLGGLAFFPIAMFSFSLMLGMRYFFGLDLPTSMESGLLITFMFLTASLLMIFFVGLADDLVEVNFKTKFLVQFICTSIMMFSGVYIRDLQGLLFVNYISPTISIPLCIIFVIWIINAYNLIDGVNGLCSGLGIIALTAFSGWYIYITNYVYAMFALSMAGVVLAFFYYNVRGKRLQIFMGDTGSLTLGFMISFLSLKFLSNPSDLLLTDAHVPHSNIALLVGLLFIPLFDTLRVFVNRMNKGLSPFHPDRTHIHHKLLSTGLSHIQSTITLLLAQIGYLLLNVLLSEILELNVNIVIIIDILLAIYINHQINLKNIRIAKSLNQK